MQPLRLIVPGEYWDSHIYSGRLFLFLRDGSIKGLNWDRIIEEWPLKEDRLRLAMQCAFQRLH